ncbi:hypothetical protein [Prolixibacter sp. SD074]|jgi:hypothetical protein|uniref:hypothetical protein n=1 Tax=Prolixibacter sp. SD074 TaxID=2652391 RepID=UPI00126F3735|nr:hypothetical protein [Prolixibacter sp. SD074]GET28785.1 hypothetical protein SD074_09870 [Prolixibacter sp. SD074]
MNYNLNEEQILSMQEIKALQKAARALAEASTVTKIPIDYLKDFIGMMALNHANKVREIPEPKQKQK